MKKKKKKTVKVRYEVKLNDTPLSQRQKEDQKKPNREVMRVSRNNPVHIGREIGRKFKKIIED